MNKKVNLFIVGAPKSGTTSLYSYLCQHPDVIGGIKKEPHFFCKDFFGFRWFNNEKEYEENYISKEEKKYAIDASVMYFFSKDAPQEIYKYNPDAKIIIILRDEEEFYLSFHNQNLYNRDENISSPNKAWYLQSDRSKGLKIPTTCREHEFLQYKKLIDYKNYLRRYYEVFPDKQIMVIPFKPWVKDLKGYQMKIFDWLSLSKEYKTEFIKENSKRKHRFKILSYLTNQPNKKVLLVSKLVKKALNIEGVSLASKIRNLNTTDAKYEDLDYSIKKEIEVISKSNESYLKSRFFNIE